MSSFKWVLALFIAGIATLASALAGSAPGYIDCASASGRTQLHIENQDLNGLTQIRLTVDQAKLEMNVEAEPEKFEGNGVYAVWDQVLAVTATERNGYKTIRFWGLPGTFKAIEDTMGATKYSFKAKVDGTDPRTGFALENEIQMNCKLDYSI